MHTCECACACVQVYIIGEVGIEEELDLIGVPWIGGGADAGKKIELKSGASND